MQQTLIHRDSEVLLDKCHRAIFLGNWGCSCSMGELLYSLSSSSLGGPSFPVTVSPHLISSIDSWKLQL